MSSTLPKSFFQEYEQFNWTTTDSQSISLILAEMRKPRTNLCKLLQAKKDEVEDNISALEQSLRHFQVDTLKPIADLVEESYQAAITPLKVLSLALEQGLDKALPLQTYEILKLRYDNGNIQWVCHIKDTPPPSKSSVVKTVQINQINNSTKTHKKNLDLHLLLVCWWLNTYGTLDVKANEKHPSYGFIEFINWLMHDGMAEPNSIQRMFARLEIKADTFKDN